MSTAHRLAGRIGGHAKWANTDDRTAATAVMRQAFLDRFEREVDPDGTLPPLVRAQRAESARKKYFAELALKRWRSRVRRKSEAA